METIFLLIYGLYINGKNHSFKNQHESNTELHTDIYYYLKSQQLGPTAFWLCTAM